MTPDSPAGLAAEVKPEASTPRGSDCMSQSIVLPNSRGGSEADSWEPSLEKC